MPAQWLQSPVVRVLFGGAVIGYWLWGHGMFRRRPNTTGYDIPVPDAPVEPDLLRAAVQAGLAQDVTRERCYWPTDEQALFLRLNPEGTSYYALLQDRSGRETPLRDFNARFASRLRGPRMQVVFEGGGEAPARLAPPEAALSPDGEWLLWQDRQAGLGGKWIAARLDGTHERTWPRCASDEWASDGAVWYRNGIQWAELILSRRWRGYVVSGVRTYHAGELPTAPTSVPASAPDGLLCGITPQDELVLRQPEPYQSLKEHRLWLIGARTGETSRLPFQLPYRATIEELQVSPSGEKLAAFLSTSIECALFPRRYALWTCNLDGSGWSLIGALEGITSTDPSSPSGSRYTWPHELAWLPSGNELSFVFNQRLYIVPAERDHPEGNTSS